MPHEEDFKKSADIFGSLEKLRQLKHSASMILADHNALEVLHKKQAHKGGESDISRQNTGS